MLTIHVWPRWVKEFLLTPPLYKSPTEQGLSPPFGDSPSVLTDGPTGKYRFGRLALSATAIADQMDNAPPRIPLRESALPAGFGVPPPPAVPRTPSRRDGRRLRLSATRPAERSSRNRSDSRPSVPRTPGTSAAGAPASTARTRRDARRTRRGTGASPPTSRAAAA